MTEHARLAHVSECARRRLSRRDAACMWFVHYCRAKWHMWPKLVTHVTEEVYAGVPQLRSSPSHAVELRRRHGSQRTRIIRYEECVELVEEAQILVTRLARLRERLALAATEGANALDISGTQT